MAKYEDPVCVDDLISRKVEQKLYESNPDFPDKEDPIC